MFVHIIVLFVTILRVYSASTEPLGVDVCFVDQNDNTLCDLEAVLEIIETYVYRREPVDGYYRIFYDLTTSILSQLEEIMRNHREGIEDRVVGFLRHGTCPPGLRCLEDIINFFVPKNKPTKKCYDPTPIDDSDSDEYEPYKKPNNKCKSKKKKRKASTEESESDEEPKKKSKSKNKKDKCCPKGRLNIRGKENDINGGDGSVNVVIG